MWLLRFLEHTPLCFKPYVALDTDNPCVTMVTVESIWYISRVGFGLLCGIMLKKGLKDFEYAKVCVAIKCVCVPVTQLTGVM